MDWRGSSPDGRDVQEILRERRVEKGPRLLSLV
jgi:hypothetical protein